MKLVINLFSCLRAVVLIITLASVLAACGDGGTDTNTAASGDPETLKEIQISLDSSRLIKGLSGRAYASGIFSNNGRGELGDLVQWTSSDSNVASIDSAGIIIGLREGTTTISANIAGMSASANLEVDDATLLSLTIEPTTSVFVAGIKQPLSARGGFDNGTVHDLTEQVVWNSSDPAVVSVSDVGMATAVSVGTTTVSAGLGDVSQSNQLTVSAATLTRLEVSVEKNYLPAGTELQLYSVGIFSDNSVLDLTHQVNWNSSNEAVATIENGLVSGVLNGSTVISLSYLGQETNIEMTVNSASLVAVNISPASPNIIENSLLQFYATAIYSDSSMLDVTDQATWVSDNEQVASIGNSIVDRGAAKGLSVGSSNITAYYDGQSQKNSLIVTAATLQNIEISPAAPRIAMGTSVQFSVIGYYDDGSNRTLTDQVNWSLNDGNIASTEGDVGRFKGLATGSSQLIVSLDGVVSFSTLTVTSATLDSIRLSPENITIAAGYKTKMTAIGHYSDASSQNISSSVIWQSSNGTIANVSNALLDKGQLTAIQNGAADVSATLGGVSANATITVSTAELTAITVQFESGEMTSGRQQQLKAIGLYSDNSSLDITQAVAWSSSDNSIAMLSNLAVDKGVISALDQGNVTVTAMLDGASGTTELTLINDPNATVSLSLNASPNVILNNGVDATNITVILQAADSSGQIADNTEINLLITEGENNYSQTISTLNGSASLFINSTYEGYIEIQASIENGISSTSYIFSTSNFSNVIARVGLLSAQYDGSTLLTGSWFALLMQNISNRDFDIEQYYFSNGIDSQIYSGLGINSGQLNYGEQYVLKITLGDDQSDEGVQGVMSFIDSVSGQNFSFTTLFTAP